jgi:hypothetical protein
MIKNGKKIMHYPIAEMKGLGTPEDLRKFLDSLPRSGEKYNQVED